MSEQIKAYPLQWPIGWKRIDDSDRKNGHFKRGNRPLSIWDGVERVLTELGMHGVTRDDLVISTNIPVRIDGLPRSDARRPQDPGVAVYWVNDGNRQCMAIDRYTCVEDNLAAVAATLEAMRAIGRHGGAEILNRSFSGFKALPEQASGPGWREVLSLVNGNPTWEDVQLQYRALSKKHHPDKGGDAGVWAMLNRAYEQAKAEFGK